MINWLYKRKQKLYNVRMNIILASSSPRRKQLLEQAGLKILVVPSNVNEDVLNGVTPQKYCKNLAVLKATSVYKGDNSIVIGADTVVCLDGKIIKKPNSISEAYSILKNLSNKTHTVITGYCVIKNGKVYSNYLETLVTFNNLSDGVICDYVSSGLPFDKAGGYGIQDGYPLVKNIVGDFNNVVGLPVNKILEILNEE